MYQGGGDWIFCRGKKRAIPRIGSMCGPFYITGMDGDSTLVYVPANWMNKHSLHLELADSSGVASYCGLLQDLVRLTNTMHEFHSASVHLQSAIWEKTDA